VRNSGSRRMRMSARRGAGSGFTLAEVMVAIAVFAVIAAIAMTLYQRLQRSFKQGENATAQQQNTRIAFDRMMADLRMAGFNYNPDGAARPDEQIEGMWTNAVTVRADYDYETADANTPEPTLGGPGNTFNVVSTGNDEIVTYALGKSSGGGGSTLTFQADVASIPRDGTVDTVNINNVYLDMNSPPYTLYRMTLKPGGTALSSIVDKVPIADNIRSMTLAYFDGAGNPLATMAQGMDDPNSIALRKKIAKINVKIIGMTQDPDLAYFDPSDTNPKSMHFRKFELTSDVTPRNLGFVGVQDLDLDKPSTPTGLSVCAGHCQGLYATWNANPPNEGVIKYQVTSGPSITSQTNPQDAYSTNYFVGSLTQGSSYVLGVKGVDGAGNMSDPGAFSSPSTVTNTTTPNPVTSFAASNIGAGNAVANQVQIGWTRPTTNSALLACDNSGGTTPLRDLAGFRLFRGGTASFDPNIPSQVQKTVDPNTLNAGLQAYNDPPDPNVPGIVNCRTYYYKAVAEDLCGLRSSVTAATGSATSAVKPAIPANPTALDMGNQTALVTWNPVTRDVNAGNILIDKYKVFRTKIAVGADPNLATYNLVYDGTVSSISSPIFNDPNLPNIPGSERYWYRVSAHDDCINESDMSMPALVNRCSFGGSVQMSFSPGGNPVAGYQTITVTITGGATPVSAQLTVRDTSNGAVIVNSSSTTYPYVFTWNAGVSPTVPGHTYDVSAAVTNSSGCTDSATTTVSVNSVIPCCITAANPRISANTTLGSVSGGKNNEVQFSIANTCAGDITIQRIAMEWDNATQNSPQLTAWEYQGQPSIVLATPTNPAISGTSPLSIFDLTVTPFTTYPLPTLNNSSNPLDVGYVFTKALVGKIKGSNVGDLIRTQYTFTVNGLSGTSKCDVSVLADPSTPGITLCDPQVDPNCPGF